MRNFLSFNENLILYYYLALSYSNGFQYFSFRLFKVGSR